jgi:undecaprenyl-diphosphatase
VTRTITHLGGARATILAGLLLALVEPEVGLAALLGNALSHLAVQALKRTVARPRPCGRDGEPLALVDLPDPFSFPSGHAAAAVAVTAPVALAWWWAAPLALGLAAVVGWSRVALRVQDASDVLAGAALGLGGALLALRLV